MRKEWTKEITDSRTLKILRKRKREFGVLNKDRNRKHYHLGVSPYMKEDRRKGKLFDGFEEEVYFGFTLPNWKLVSKNKRQWMEYRLKFSKQRRWRHGNAFSYLIEI